MAQKRDDRLKRLLLLAFVAANVLLAVMIWVDGLRARGGDLPGYYRQVPAGVEERPPAQVTPFPEAGETEDGRHQGGREAGTGPDAGRVRATATPLPEGTEALPILPSLDGDDA